MNSLNKTIIAEYHKKKASYEKLLAAARQEIDEIIDSNDFFVMTVASRVKDVDSLQGKLERKEGKYSELSNITDICGFRIICYFEDTVDAIAQVFRTRFKCDEKNSIDKRQSIQATQFGYLSLHIICSFREDSGVDSEIIGLPFEIQIRTVLQHAWAEIEHDLGYKSDFGIPKPIRRSFSRVAGLLEIADKQFIDLRREAKQYTIDVRERIDANNCDDILLDFSSLREFLKHNILIVDFEKRLKDELNLEIEYTESTSLLRQLSWMEINTLGDLNALLLNNGYFIFNKIKKLVEMYELDIMTANMIIRYACEGELLRRNEIEERVRKFYSLTISDEKRLDRAVAQFYKEAEAGMTE